jgi:IS5 family transposase
VVTAANMHELIPAAELLHGDEQGRLRGCGLPGHRQKSREGRQDNGIQGGGATRQAHAPTRHIKRQAEDLIETAKADIHSKLEHPFRVIKQQFGFQKNRLRGLTKKLPDYP